MSEWEAPTPVQLAERVEDWQHRLALLGVGHFRITSVTIDDQTPAGPHAQASAQIADLVFVGGSTFVVAELV